VTDLIVSYRGANDGSPFAGLFDHAGLGQNLDVVGKGAAGHAGAAGKFTNAKAIRASTN
jgi:hypothetical protein